ncbi:2TM domain-containing protein [Microbacterium schleiferi]|uniref:2TM domain-containing protein n=1 Tax=Microbacterium schleiferi TaxID=69362 RepID=A0ABU7V1V7_9MICO|nr:2TM domain-containing protein [Micrococcales bacterium]
MTDSQDPAGSDDLRQRAVASLRAKQGFWYSLATWVVLSAFFVLIWALTGMGGFWPVWPIAGIAIGVAFAGIRAYGPSRGGLTESKIQDEMRRLQ